MGYCPTSEPSLSSVLCNMRARPTEPQFVQLRQAPPKLGWLGVTRLMQGGSASVQEAQVREQPRVRLQVRASQNEDISAWQ